MNNQETIKAVPDVKSGSVKLFYGIILLTSTGGLFLLSLLSIFFVWINLLILNSISDWSYQLLFLIIMIFVPFIGIMILSFIKPKNESQNVILLSIKFFFYALFYGFLIGTALLLISFGTRTHDNSPLEIIKYASLQLASVIFIPVGILFLTGILGMLKIINVRSLIVMISVLLFAILVTFLISFFAFRQRDNINWWIGILMVALISLFMILQWYSIRKTADYVEYMSIKSLITLGIQHGLQLFISLAQLLYFVIVILVKRR
ncbi:hypothetical protein U5U50_00630 [Mycoplasma sp. 888]|uniref:MAG0110 family membrane protein n=1 Tax=Mycoplasma sp. 888 TaxID=3108483 RepID=UPI002D76D534|nr:hypothetical protein [Mycoplasma sp. 888]WRQ25895.1 hypothetical protein U5U50_00630 [Mycoplasma sp. 888]